MKISRSILFLILTITAGNGMADAVDSEKPPNIIYINADDLGVMDVGFNSPRYRTPNIDKLRTEGMLFSHAYAPASNCAPSRACVFSGQYSPRHGVYTVNNSDRGKSRDRKLIPTRNTEQLSPDNLTLAAALQENGYRTIHLGKWHVGEDPLTQGFDVNIGGDRSGSPTGGYFVPFKAGSMKPYNKHYPSGTHRVDIFADQAIKFMRKNKGRAFFMHMAYYSVHTRIEAVPEFIDNYKGKPVHAPYASMIEKMDQGIGRILDELEELGLKDNTLVLFCSDNGGLQNISSQKPHRSGKGSYFEGGIREPLVVRWPSVIPANSTCNTPVIGTDFYPTFLEITRTPGPTDKILDGVSLLPLLNDSGPIPDRGLFWHFPVYLQKSGNKDYESHDSKFRTRPGSALRMGKWKLHEYFEDGRIELYNLESDPGERNNLSKSKPEKTSELHEALKKWRKELKAPVPSELNPEFVAKPAR